MFDTQNDLPNKTRSAVVDLLNARLADAIDLGAQAKQAHWNVKGPHFIALHEKVRKGIDKSGKLGDADTADLFTEISRDVDKYLWFLEAHLYSRS
jgi:DNA-binding ferritin-like protein